MGLLESGTNWLTSVFQATESTPVSYARGNQTLSVRATRGQTEIPIVDAQGLESVFRAADFLIPAASIDFGAGPVDPEPGDQITDGSRVYRVQRVPGADCFRFSDPDRLELRIHAKLWKVE